LEILTPTILVVFYA